MNFTEIDDRNHWDINVEQHGGHPLQLSGWGEVKAAHGWQVHRVRCEGEPWKGAQILLRALPGPFKSLAYIPRGPVGPWSQADYDALAEYVRSTYGSVCLMIEPALESITLGKRWRRSPNHIFIPRTLILDLTKSEDELLADIAAKRRYDIRKSTKGIARFGRLTTPEELAACLELYHQTATRAGFALHGDSYYSDIATLGGDQSQIIGAWSDSGELLAFTWFLVSRKTAFELYSGISDNGQRLRANYGLKWYCITTMKQQGVERYDFNGLLNDGISGFKKSFGSTETMLVGTYDAPLSPLYTLYVHILPLGKRLARGVGRLKQR